MLFKETCLRMEFLDDCVCGVTRSSTPPTTDGVGVGANELGQMSDSVSKSLFSTLSKVGSGSLIWKLLSSPQILSLSSKSSCRDSANKLSDDPYFDCFFLFAC